MQLGFAGFGSVFICVLRISWFCVVVLCRFAGLVWVDYWITLIVLVGGLCLPDKCMVWFFDCWFWLIVLFLVSGGVGCLGSLWVWLRVDCSIFLILRLDMGGIDVSLGCGSFV